VITHAAHVYPAHDQRFATAAHFGGRKALLCPQRLCGDDDQAGGGRGRDLGSLVFRAFFFEILADECEADPDLAHLLGQEPSTATLVELTVGMVRHFLHISDSPDQQEAQRIRLMITSHLDDGEFARLLYAKVGDLIGPVFAASIDRAVAAGEATRIGSEPLNLFWFAHHTVLMAAVSRMPVVPCLSYGNAADLERQLCEFILRGIGLNEAAIASHLARELSPGSGQPVTAESA
jgi:hypothetical protein